MQVPHDALIFVRRTLKSPQILELSGVGAPDVLKKIDVPVKVELPGVGANLQDHILIGATFGEPWQQRHLNLPELP